MHTDQWDERYANQAHGHQHGGGSSSASSELAGFVAASGPRIRRAVDLGCGTGADAVFLATCGIEAIGIDGSAVAIEQARERASRAGVDVEWHVGDVLALPLADASVDLACDRGCLHHVPAGDRGRYAAEVARVLRVGGQLVLRDVRGGPHGDVLDRDALRGMLDGVPLEVTASVPFEMGGRHALMVVLARTDAPVGAAGAAG